MLGNRPRTTGSDLTRVRRHTFLLEGMPEELGPAMNEFCAANLSKAGGFDLEFFVEAQCVLAAALGREPDAIASTASFFRLVEIGLGADRPPRDIFMRWQAAQEIVKSTSTDRLAAAMKQVTKDLLEKRTEGRPVSKQGERAALDARTRELALIEASSHDRTEKQRQKEVQAIERHAIKLRKKAGEQGALAMFAKDRDDNEALQKALDGEYRFLRQAAAAEAEARRRMGGHGRRRG